MRTTTSGLLLLLIGVTALAGFLTGNLDRWLAYLFDPNRPTLGTAAAGAITGGTGGGAARASGERRPVIQLGTPRIVPLLLLVGALAAANRLTPGLVQAVLALIALYLIVTHGPQVGDVLLNASAGLGRGFGVSAASGPAGGGKRK